MAATLIKQVRLEPETVEYFQNLSDKDRRSFADYLRVVLETVQAKGLTWQDLDKLQGKTDTQAAGL